MENFSYVDRHIPGKYYVWVSRGELQLFLNLKDNRLH